MNEMNTKWQQIYRKDKVQEHFYLGEFIQSDRWLESSPPKFKTKRGRDPRGYPYHKDGFEYGEDMYTFDNGEIHVTEMMHATSLEHVLSIINKGGFTSQEKYFPGIGHTSLVWFALKIEAKEIDYLKEYSKRIVQAQMRDKLHLKADEVLSKIAHSPAFQPVSFYGHFKFTVGIKQVLDAYKTQFRRHFHYPAMRKLGTFAYKQETMHVILVCPPNTPSTDYCPLLSDDPVIQPDARLRTWTWKPHSTGNEYIYFLNSGYPWINGKRWEHVALALHVPKGSCLEINDLERRVSWCLKRSKKGNVRGVKRGIKKVLDFIESSKATEKNSLADTLISMIAGYLKDEHLYKKTMEDYMFEEYVGVDLEKVYSAYEIYHHWNSKR